MMITVLLCFIQHVYFTPVHIATVHITMYGSSEVLSILCGSSWCYGGVARLSEWTQMQIQTEAQI